MPKTLICLAFLVILGEPIFGTAQNADRIIVEGSEYSLFNEPLEWYFAKYCKRPQVLTGGIRSTDCWRGYVATWELQHDSLFLIKVSKEYPIATGAHQTEWCELPLNELIPGADYPLFASWFSGILCLPQGKLLNYVHLGYASRYEKNMVFALDSGCVTARGVVENKYADKFQSDADRKWVALGEPPKDPGKWFDARLFGCKEISLLLEKGDTVVTRGIINGLADMPTLWIPSTDTTEGATCMLSGMTKSKLRQMDGQHVEIKAVLTELTEMPTLDLFYIRPLRYGETIHSPELPGLMDHCPELIGHNWLY
ncbi:MAG TPA: hypothetical protein PLF13_05315 [candidate division Zixibacteria bacterium]|nr:hypothetical protein [candidate division Zixibacteria bacterium]